jgi:hypothetical protein
MEKSQHIKRSWNVNIQYKCEVSIIICLWNLENYQPENKKIADIYK